MIVTEQILQLVFWASFLIVPVGGTGDPAPRYRRG